MIPRVRSALFTVLGVAVVAALIGLGALLSAQDAPLRYTSADYDVQVLANGDMRVHQSLDIQLRERKKGKRRQPWRQLYQEYRLNPRNLTAISQIRVYDDAGHEYRQIAERPDTSAVSSLLWTQQYAYTWYVVNAHTGQPYEPDLSGNPDAWSSATLEIGWNIPATFEQKSFRVHVDMTMHDVATQYADVTRIMWEPVGLKNQVPIGRLSARVTLPEGAQEQNSWSWLHYAGLSTTRREGNVLHFQARNIAPREHVDLVTMFDASLSSQVRRVWPAVQMKDQVLRQEREEFEAFRLKMRLWLLAVAVLAVLVLGLAVLVVRSRRRGRFTPSVEYWRESLPFSASAAAKILQLIRPKAVASGSLVERQITATMLALVSRKCIALYPGSHHWYAKHRDLLASPRQVAEATMGEDLQSDRDQSTTIVVQDAAFQEHTVVTSNEELGKKASPGEQVLRSWLHHNEWLHHNDQEQDSHHAGQAQEPRFDAVQSHAAVNPRTFRIPDGPSVAQLQRSARSTSPEAAGVSAASGSTGAMKSTGIAVGDALLGMLGLPVRTPSGGETLEADGSARAASQSGHPRQPGRLNQLSLSSQLSQPSQPTVLYRSEDALLACLRLVSNELGDQVFDMKQLKQAMKDSTSAGEQCLLTDCQEEYDDLAVERPCSRGIAAVGSLTVIAGIVLTICCLLSNNLALVVMSALVTLLALFVRLIMPRVKLTERGRVYANQVWGLYAYLRDFSDFSDRDLPDQTLWEDYLVYAAAFGLSERVAKRFARALQGAAHMGEQQLDAMQDQWLLYSMYQPWMRQQMVASGYGETGFVESGWNADSLAYVMPMDLSNLSSDISESFTSLGSILSDSSGDFGGFSGGGFDGSSGGSGGGSFGGR